MCFDWRFVSLTFWGLQTVKYLQKIPEVRDAVGSALVALGDGNWRMGEGIQVGKASKGGETDEQVVTEHFIRVSFFCFTWHESLTD